MQQCVRIAVVHECEDVEVGEVHEQHRVSDRGEVLHSSHRGNEDPLFEASHEIGGQFNVAKQVPGKEEFHETIRYFGRKLELTGVTVKLNTRVTRAEHMGNVRMYDSFGAILRGFEKNSFRFLKENAFTGIQVVLASILLTSWLPVLILLLLNHLWRQAILFGLLPSVILFPWYRSASTLLAPVAIYLFQYVALNGMFKTLTGRKSIWKGREV